MVGNPFFADEQPGLPADLDHVLPALLETGVTQEQIDQMMVANPQRFFGA